jgi:alkylated DNA nucleotide flippase Atl1
VRVQDLDFITLIQGTKQFQIPMYQRTYSWREENIARLCDDLAAEASRRQSPNAGHFMGSLVFIPAPQPVDGIQIMAVVDGQQRLTSLMIGLCALRDHVRRIDKEWAQRITEYYLVNKWRTGDEYFRLLPSQIDRAAFRECINGHGNRLPAGSRIADAYRAFRAWLLKVGASGTEALQSLESTICTSLRFVAITADQSDNPHRIFETINNTGQRLSQADLIRNYFFMTLQSAADSAYRDIWLPMQDRVKPEGVGRLMWLDLVISGEKDVDPDDLYRPLVNRFSQADDPPARVKEHLLELNRKSFLLQLLQSPELEADPGLREQLARLKEWEQGSEFPASYVPALFFLDLRDRGLITTADVTAALRLIESYVVRRTIVDTVANPMKTFLTVPTRLAGSRDVVTDLRRLLSTAKQPWPSDSQVRQAIIGKPFYYHGKHHHRVFVLRRLEESYENPERVDWRQPVYSIEHVLPRSITPEWTTALQPDATRYGVATRELHRLVVHTLGNLTLSGKNSALSNSPFSEKKKILSTSALVMNRRIADRPVWNASEIERRGLELAERATTIWPGPIDAAQVTVTDEWATLHQALALTPAGCWVNLAHLAGLLGKRPRELATYLLAEAPTNWYRVLGSAGSVLEGARDGETTQRELLEAEDVTFMPNGLANPKQRLDVRRIAAQLGFDVPKRSTTGASKRPITHLRHKQRRR